LVEACQAQKAPDIFYRARHGPGRDGRKLVGERLGPVAIHKISTKLDFALSKRAFLELREEFLSSEAMQNSSEVGKVSRVRRVMTMPSMYTSAKARQKVVHGALKGTGGIAKYQRHCAKFEAPKRGLKRSLRDMLWFYANLVVALLQVHLYEVFRACHIVR